MLKKIVNNPYLNFIAGILLLLTSGVELFELESLGEVSGNHGVFVYSLLIVLKSIPEILHGLEEVEKAREERNSIT